VCQKLICFYRFAASSLVANQRRRMSKTGLIAAAAVFLFLGVLGYFMTR